MNIFLISYVGLMLGGQPLNHRDNAPRTCDVTSLFEVFRNPTHYFGRSFCGTVLILRDGRGLKIFPPTRRLPDDRNDIVMLLDDEAENLITRTRGTSFRFYLEGVISGMDECFEAPESGFSTSCEPIMHPLFIHVSRFRRQQQANGAEEHELPIRSANQEPLNPAPSDMTGIVVNPHP